jgi:hypothetical protein
METCNDLVKGSIIYYVGYKKVVPAIVTMVKKDGLVVSARFKFNKGEGFIPYSTLITGHKNGDTLVGDSSSIFYVCKDVATNKLREDELRSRAFDLCWHLGALKFNTTVQSQDIIKYLKS